VEVLRFNGTVDSHLSIFDGNSSAALRLARFSLWAPPDSPTHVVYAPGPSLFVAVEGSVENVSLHFEFVYETPSRFDAAAITKAQLLEAGAPASLVDLALKEAPRLFDRRCARAGELAMYRGREDDQLAGFLVNAALLEWAEISNDHMRATDRTVHMLLPVSCVRCESRLLQAHQLAPRSLYVHLQDWMARNPWCSQRECYLKVGGSVVSALVRHNRRLGPYFIHSYRGVYEFYLSQSEGIWRSISDNALAYRDENGSPVPEAAGRWIDDLLNTSKAGPLTTTPLLPFCESVNPDRTPMGLEYLCSLVMMLVDLQARIGSLDEAAEDIIEAAEGVLEFGFHHRRIYSMLCRYFMTRVHTCSSSDGSDEAHEEQIAGRSPSQLVLAYATDVCQAGLLFEHGTAQHDEVLNSAWLELLAAVTNTGFDPRGATRRARMYSGCVIGLGPSSNWPHNSAYVNGEPYVDGTLSKPLEPGAGIPYNWYDPRHHGIGPRRSRDTTHHATQVSALAQVPSQSSR
jgi:hypothetical protein